MGKWCLHASSFIFDRIIFKVAGNQDSYKSLDEFDFGPLVANPEDRFSRDNAPVQSAPLSSQP